MKILLEFFLFLILLDLSKRFNSHLLQISIMGDMRKDYVSERFMIVSKKTDKVVDPKKSPFAPGNESMTNLLFCLLLQKMECCNVFKIMKMNM